MPLEMLGALLPPARSNRLMSAGAGARALLADRVVWNVSATAQGGGVAEMLQVLLAYGRGAGVDTRWLVLDGDPAFFAITKRLHNSLHGSLERGITFSASEQEHYERVLAENLVMLADRVQPGDIVLLHDPQTAGLINGMRRTGAHIIWRCHIGRDNPNAATDIGWQFLRHHIESADAVVFSRRRYVPDWVAPDRVWVIPPSIDPFSAKNRDLDDVEVGRVLRKAGVLAGRNDTGPLEFTRRDGSAGFVRPHDGLVWGSAPPPAEAPLIVQVSRWDRLKDMLGVLTAFAENIAISSHDVHLMLAGPDVSGVTDDPEGAEVLAACRDVWGRLPDLVRKRCHLASIPMDDLAENALIVNALQRHATVVVQKSLAEGFGLTVTEAMWKSRPVVASAVGGIQDQITNGDEGLLLPDPHDLDGFAQRLQVLLDDHSMSERMGQRGHDRVRDHYLGDRHLIQYADLFRHLIGQGPNTAP